MFYIGSFNNIKYYNTKQCYIEYLTELAPWNCNPEDIWLWLNKLDPDTLEKIKITGKRELDLWQKFVLNSYEINLKIY